MVGKESPAAALAAAHRLASRSDPKIRTIDLLLETIPVFPLASEGVMEDSGPAGGVMEDSSWKRSGV